MMYKISPEVPGSIGSNSVIEYEGGKIKNIKFLEYEFEGWFGDELLTSSPCYIITERLAEFLDKNKLTGFACDDNIKTTKSEIFEYYHPNVELPTFLRMLVKGVVEINEGKITRWSGHDFCLYRNVMLYVTERAFQSLKTSGKMLNFTYKEIELDLQGH